ncbi:MAG: AraC family transcriptional regulator [Eubacteriales bacterium]|nr:AraC family transcriptional regulator [Eubacteriales bacterium]
MNTILFVGEHPRTFDVRRHTHEHWELVYCTSGQGAFKFENGSVIHYQAGDVVAIPPRQVHANSSEEGFTNIYVTMADPSFSYKTCFRISDDDEGNMKMAFMQARYFYMGDFKNAELVLSALGDLIVGYMIVFHSNEGLSEPVEKLCASIRRNYCRSDYALDEVIRGMPFHYDYLRKLFKKEVGISPLEYLTKLRMKNAETLLTTMWANAYSISEIAHMCGFEDALYFSRVFKKYYGCSPTSYSKKRNTIYQQDPSRIELEE